MAHSLSMLQSFGAVSSVSCHKLASSVASIHGEPVSVTGVTRNVYISRPATVCKAEIPSDCQSPLSRRESIAALSLALAAAGTQSTAIAAALPPNNDNEVKLCVSDCEAELEKIPMTTLPSGLQYRDITVGKGPSPPTGFQVAADYVAMLPTGRVFDSSLEKGVPYIFRIGAGQVIRGLDEGILSMKAGGTRRLYIPGELAFPKGLNAAAGRPRVPPSSPVVFDVSLLYIPGLESDDE